jgi:uncharacterized membrane protein YgcG
MRLKKGERTARCRCRERSGPTCRTTMPAWSSSCSCSPPRASPPSTWLHCLAPTPSASRTATNSPTASMISVAASALILQWTHVCSRHCACHARSSVAMRMSSRRVMSRRRSSLITRITETWQVIWVCWRLTKCCFWTRAPDRLCRRWAGIRPSFSMHLSPEWRRWGPSESRKGGGGRSGRIAPSTSDLKLFYSFYSSHMATLHSFY